jgi:hypothetical protein
VPCTEKEEVVLVLTTTGVELAIVVTCTAWEVVEVVWATSAEIESEDVEVEDAPATVEGLPVDAAALHNAVFLVSHFLRISRRPQAPYIALHPNANNIYK